MTVASTSLARPRRHRALSWGALPPLVRYVLLFVLIVAVWQVYVSVTHVSRLLFASPWQTGSTLWEDWTNGSLAGPTWTTLRILLEGIGIGIAVAIVLTVFATLSTVGADLLALLTSLLNPLPGVAVLPLAMLWFGINENAIIFTIANATIWPVAINLSTGFKTVSPTLVAVGRNIGLSKIRVITDVLVPAALPHAVSGLKTAWAFGWRTVIAAELVFGVAGSKGGLGNYINNARLYLLTPRVFAGLVTIAVLGVAFESLFAALERRTIVRWGMKTS